MTAIALEGSFIYRSPLHSGSVLAALNVLWKQQDLCDVTILVDGYHLQAHKAVLAACSAYFRGLFTDPKREKDISMVEMHGVSVTGFKSLLDFMYSSSLTLNAQNIYDVHNAATFLGMQEAAQVCMQIFDKAAKTEKGADETPQQEKVPWEHTTTEGRGSARSSAAGTPMQSPSRSSQSSNSSNNTPAQSPMAASPMAASPRAASVPGEANMNTTRALLLNSRHPYGAPDPAMPMPPPQTQPLEGAAKRKKRSLSSVVSNLVESKSKQDTPAQSSKSQHPIQQVEVRNSNSFTYRSGSNVGSMIVTSSTPTPMSSTSQPITIPPIIIKDVFSLNNNYINTSAGSKKGPSLFSGEARPLGFNSPPTSFGPPPPPPTGRDRHPQPPFPLPQGMPMMPHHVPTSIPQPRGHILPQMVLRPPISQPAVRAPMQHPRVPPRQAYKFHQYVTPPPHDQGAPLRMEDVRVPPSSLNKDEQAPLPHQIRIPQASASEGGRIKMDKTALLKQLREPQQMPSPPKPAPRPDTATHFGLVNIPSNRPPMGIPPPQPRKEQEPFQQDDQQTRFYLNLVDYRNKHLDKQASAQPVSVSVHPPSQSLPHNSAESLPLSQTEAPRPTYPPPLLVDPRHTDPQPLSPPEVDLYRPKMQDAETAGVEETIILMPEDFQKKNKRRLTSTTEESPKKPRQISMEEALHASTAVSVDGREEEAVVSRPRSICSDPGLPTETMRKTYAQANESSAASVCSSASLDEPQENGLSTDMSTVRSRHSSEPSDVHKRNCRERAKVFEEDEGDSYRCSTCNKTFTDHGQFRAHVREEHVNHKVHECEKCNATFKYSGALKTHMRVHTGEKPFACDKCGARFTQLGNLHRHKKTHDGLKPYQCGLCNARFTRLGSVQEHLKIHTGEKKPFQCKVCTAEFTRHGHLRNHMRIHSGERPFSCSVCGAQFRHPGGLKQHKKIHQRTCFETSPHICESCGALFTRLGDLRTHRKLHDGGKPTPEELDGDMSD
ncbi:Kelch-like 26 [Branchiostoma belcheri]|nr:Kelch-like 26 [Branchiostoma belcheri]